MQQERKNYTGRKLLAKQVTVQCCLTMWQVISTFPVRWVLPNTGLCGRCSGELLETLEVSLSDSVTKNTSASAAEQWLVNGVDTTSPTRSHKQEGPRIDTA